ncbi:hypothetical protein BH09BAC6_BH09BAC6_07700 [soil metagenome]|jgi:hypothetical protein
MNKNELIGIWRIDQDDKITQELYGPIIIEFKDDGILVYTIISEEKKQVIIMTYEIQGNNIITDQPSSPKKEMTKFKKLNNKLILEFGGIKSVFIKA